MILSAEELVELTHLRRPSAQRRALDTLSVAYRVRPDGTIVVFKDQIHHAPAQNQPPAPRLRLS